MHLLTFACDLLPAGQLSQVGRQFYNTDIEVEILSKEETEKMTYVVGTLPWPWLSRSVRSPTLAEPDAASISKDKLPGVASCLHSAGSVYWLDISVYMEGTVGKHTICRHNISRTCVQSLSACHNPHLTSDFIQHAACTTGQRRVTSFTEFCVFMMFKTTQLCRNVQVCLVFERTNSI